MESLTHTRQRGRWDLRRKSSPVSTLLAPRRPVFLEFKLAVNPQLSPSLFREPGPPAQVHSLQRVPGTLEAWTEAACA